MHHQLCCTKGLDGKEGPTVSKDANNSVGVSLSSHSGRERVLLPIATVHLHGIDGQGVTAKLILDSGSDRSFVSDRLIRRVKGTWKGSAEMSYDAFGGGKGDGVYDVFELQLATATLRVPAAQLKLEAVRVPVICAPRQRPSVPVHLLDAFSHLPLADDYTENQDQQVDILVGQDQYWSLVRTGLFRSPEGLVAQETVFGWVLSGQAVGGLGVPPGEAVVACQLLTMTDISSCKGKHMWTADKYGRHCDEGGRVVSVSPPPCDVTADSDSVVVSEEAVSEESGSSTASVSPATGPVSLASRAVELPADSPADSQLAARLGMYVCGGSSGVDWVVSCTGCFAGRSVVCEPSGTA